MQFYGKAQSVATRIVEQFQAGNIPKALAQVFIKRKDDIPCRAWSWTNQLLSALASHDDARSYLDWQSVGRQVRKGERSFHILEPCKKKIMDADPDTGQERERMAVYGFRAGARFGLEQTDVTDADEWAKHNGRDHEADRFLDALPFASVARSWNLSVRSFNGRPGSALGRYRRGESIAIGVENVSTWAHELVHAADDRLGALQERGQHWRSETVAELGGAVLLSCIGQDNHADLGGCWDYIQSYARENGKDPANAAMSILGRLCKAVALILETADGLAGKPESEAA
jgi:hypothetical protein